ncbi:MAG: glycerate kinase, partial [Alphaproteobacteria bacterium]
RDPRLAATDIRVACNTAVPLLGPRGVGRMFGAQKGAPPAALDWLDLALSSFASIVRRDLGVNVVALPGAGASGGAGAGLHALLGARLCSRYEVVEHFCDLDARLRRADVAITAEGRLDGQTPMGKVPAEIGRRAAAAGVPVIALAGTLGSGATGVLAHGVDALFSIAPGPCSLDAAIAATERHLTAAAANVVRTLCAGIALGRRRAADPA